jgi:hypothetical protein
MAVDFRAILLRHSYQRKHARARLFNRNRYLGVHERGAREAPSLPFSAFLLKSGPVLNAPIRGFRLLTTWSTALVSASYQGRRAPATCDRRATVALVSTNIFRNFATISRQLSYILMERIKQRLGGIECLDFPGDVHVPHCA